MDLETLFEQVERNSHSPLYFYGRTLHGEAEAGRGERLFRFCPQKRRIWKRFFPWSGSLSSGCPEDKRNWYVTDDMGFLRRHLKAEGTLLKIPCGRRLAAFLALRFPKDAADSLFPYAVQYAGAAKGDERLCAHMETVAVHPDFYGNGLMKKLLEEGISLAEREGMRYLLATVHPDNRFKPRKFRESRVSAVDRDAQVRRAAPPDLLL